MITGLTLLASARRDGNSESLAREAMAGAATVDWTVLSLDDYPLLPFRDVRHAGERTYVYPTGHAATLLEHTLAADVLLLAVPLYWYSLPAPAKLYLDHWSHWMRVPGLEFRERMAGKQLYATSAMSGGDASEFEGITTPLRLTAEYMGMVLGRGRVRARECGGGCTKAG